MSALARLVSALTVLLLAAAGSPAVEPEERERLFESLRNAPTETAARAAEDAIWRMWMAEGPTAKVRREIAGAMKARDGYELDKALEILDEVVAAAPEYAEGWNQRAFVHFLKENHDAALADLDRALELEPRHFAALSGKALVLMRQGRVELAQKVLRQAIEIDPWLKERHMIVPKPGEVVPPPGGTPL